MSTDGNDPAFPCTTGSDGGIFQEGMTLREYYAGKLIVKFASWGVGEIEKQKLASEAAKEAVRFADALIAELRKDDKDER